VAIIVTPSEYKRLRKLGEQSEKASSVG